MFGDRDQRAEACLTSGRCPLPSIESFRPKDGWVLGSVSPLTIGEGIHPKMQEKGKFITLPRQLCWRRYRPRQSGVPARSNRCWPRSTSGDGA
jgi:hypothetical protein